MDLLRSGLAVEGEVSVLVLLLHQVEQVAVVLVLLDRHLMLSLV